MPMTMVMTFVIVVEVEDVLHASVGMPVIMTGNLTHPRSGIAIVARVC